MRRNRKLAIIAAVVAAPLLLLARNGYGDPYGVPIHFGAPTPHG